MNTGAGTLASSAMPGRNRGCAHATAPRAVVTASGPPVVWLDDARAAETPLTGAKAAALSCAAVCGLPVIGGFVVTTGATAASDDGESFSMDDEVERAWMRLSDGGETPLVVRSSSVAEDLADTSMAGRFESVVGVTGRRAFVDAVTTVLDSRSALREAGEDAGHAPIAVLVQREVEAAMGGVLFSADPITGDARTVVVSAVAGGPEGLVSGTANGSTYKLTPEGKITSADRSGDGAEIDAATAQQLAGLASACVERFGGPQDIEWALDQDGALWLLQTRPMTTAVGTPTGPVLGPGPVSETFPDPLYPLEADLWVPPLRRAVREALLLTGLSAKRLEASPLVVSLRGRVAVDLELFNAAPPDSRRWYHRLNPAPRLRRLRAAWRVGRLQSALPGLAEDLVERVDQDLLDVPDLETLTSRQIAALLEQGREALVALHGHEILVGLLVSDSQPQLTGTAVALRTLARARATGLSDHEIIATTPGVLALVPPKIGGAREMPATQGAALPALGFADDQRDALLREALRLRVRWVHELQARAAHLLGERLAGNGALAAPILVRRLRLDELTEIVQGRAVPWQVHEGRRDPDPHALPSALRLSAERGDVLAVAGGPADGGQGAGGGSAEGPVHRYKDGQQPPQGSVLVVRTLSPDLAPHLGQVRALVAETGSPLAHVAILAREQGVPTVVGVNGACDEFDDGDLVTVDGTTGHVVRTEGEA